MLTFYYELLSNLEDKFSFIFFVDTELLVLFYLLTVSFTAVKSVCYLQNTVTYVKLQLA